MTANAQVIIDQLAACGIAISADGDELVLTGRVTPVHVAFVREHKTALLATLLAANDPAPLAVDLANLAGLDAGRMLEGDLSEPEWDRWGIAVAVLSGRLDDAGKARLAALIRQIDARWMANRGEVRQ